MDHWLFRKFSGDIQRSNIAASLALLLVGGYMIFNPFYMFPSGQPQPSDFLAVIAIFLVLSGIAGRLSIHRQLYLFGFLFTFWVSIVNFGFFLLYPGNFDFLISSLFYIYNVSLLILFVTLADKFGERFLCLVGWGIVLSAALEMFIVVTGVGSEGRVTGSFNNPNQMGYWAILNLSSWLMINRTARHGLIDLFVFVSSAYVIVISTSRAAIGGLLILVLCMLFFYRIDKKVAIAAVFLASLLFLINPAMIEKLTSPFLDLSSRLEVRVEQKGYTDSAGGRGYDWITTYPQYAFLGSGEGQLDRFQVPNGPREIHSTFGSLLFSYGVVGVIFFLGIIAAVFRHADMRAWMLLAPSMFYGLTHNGLRFSLLWVFLALTFACYRSKRTAPARVDQDPALLHQDRRRL